MKRATLTLAMTALLVTGTACGGTVGASPDKQVPSLSGQRAAGQPADRMQPYREVVECLRQNGLPSMPDPVLDDQGQPTFPEEMRQVKENPALQQACAGQIARLPARQSDRATKAISAEDMARQRRFAQCLRENGMPNVSDPDPVDGSIDLSAEGPLDKTSPRMQAALQACSSLGVSGLGFRQSRS